MNNKIFLGGACTSDWRSKLIPLLDVEYFNPVVTEWSEEHRLNEEKEKSTKCNIHLYMIDSTMTGKYSFVELGFSLNQIGVKVIVQVNGEGFTDKEMDNMEAVINFVTENGGTAFFDDGVEYLATILNN